MSTLTILTPQNLIKQALEYAERGWSIIPVPTGSKQADFSWGPFQTERPSSDQLEEWFETDSNIAVILGKVSGGLACCDFDSMDTYEAWAAVYPDLAAQLPTVRTARGMHVYFKANLEQNRQFEDFELKGEGMYMLLPPSKHPSGPMYEWVIPLPAFGDLPYVNPEEWVPHLVNSTQEKSCMLTEHTEHAEHSEQTEHTLQTHHSEHTETVVLESTKEEIIQRTVPVRAGTRNRQVFELVRALKLLPGQWDKDPNSFKSLVWRWYEKALPVINTKDFLETWVDFLNAWNNITYGDIDPKTVFSLCEELQPPKKICEDWPTYPELQKLCLLCKHLHEKHSACGSKAFLSVRTIRDILGISPETASQYIRLLEHEGYIRIVEKGWQDNQGNQRATRFEYIHNEEE